MSASLGWLAAQMASCFATAFSASSGGRAPQTFTWRQPFDGLPGGEIWLTIPQPAHDGGTEPPDAQFLDLLDQSMHLLGSALEARLGRAIRPQGGLLDAMTPEDLESTSVALSASGTNCGEAVLACSRELRQALDACAPPNPASPRRPPPDCSNPRPSKTMDLLMEVELPVGVSFGRTQMRLKDAIKLSTGSIVELNRSVSEPVEVIVNNCVIARGEVVVIEGNYGVRIREIISREERLRTLF